MTRKLKIEHFVLWTLVILFMAVLLCILARGYAASIPEQAAFGATPEAAYNEPYIGTRLGLVGELRGRGGNKSMHWLDIAPVGSKGVKGARCYYVQDLLHHGALIECVGDVTAPGKVRLRRLTIIVNDPAR